MTDDEDALPKDSTEAVSGEVRTKAMASILAAIQEHRGILNTFHDESDRGAILVAAAFLDSTLERLLRSVCVNDGVESKRMFSFEGPLGSFSARINVAFAMGLIHSNTVANLHRVRRIRNECAHSPGGVDFDTDIVRDLTSGMWQVDSFIPAEVRSASRRDLTRARFLMNAAMVYGQLLLILRSAEGTKREPLWLAHQMGDEVARVKGEQANSERAASEVASESRIAELDRVMEANLLAYAMAAGITVAEARERLDVVEESHVDEFEE